MRTWALALTLVATNLARGADIIAHRGGSAAAPENTLAAFEQGWAEGADAVELDVRLTRDGRVVVIHDGDTERTTGTKLVVADATLAELQRLDAGAWMGEEWRGQRIPTLGQVLAGLPQGKLVVIEIKCGVEVLGPLDEVLRTSGVGPGQVRVIGFDGSVLAAFTARRPDIGTLLLSGFWRDGLGRSRPTAEELCARAFAADCDGVSIHAEDCVDEGFMRTLGEAGLFVVVWTVNDPAVARRLVDLGVDAVTTDRPGFLREALTARPHARRGR